MKAIVITQPGDADVLSYTDAPDPVPAQGETLVRVRATAVNRADLMQRRGIYAPPPGASDILGLELVGEIVQPVGRWKAGDRVMALVTGGGYAELAAVPVEMLMPIPANLSWTEAATIPESFLTAYLNLFTLGGLQRGETVLIHAGASGVGVAAIQLARVAGARVFTTAGSDDKLARCHALGAEVTINYKSEKFAEQVSDRTGGRGVDLILDFVGAPYWNDNMAALAQDGRLMIIGFLGGSVGRMDIGAILRKRLTVKGAALRVLPFDQKVRLTQMLSEFALPHFESGELVPVLDSVFPLAKAADAHRYMEANRNTGKIVLEV